MRKGTIDRLLDELNTINGVKSGQMGYSYFADIKGDGGPIRRKVYTVISPLGGVTYSPFNALSRNVTAARIRAAILKAKESS